jgi:hypothetical protein
MRTLYESCQTKIKIWRDFPDGSHNDTVAERGYFDNIEGFVRDVVLGRKTKIRASGKDDVPSEELEKL